MQTRQAMQLQDTDWEATCGRLVARLPALLLQDLCAREALERCGLCEGRARCSQSPCPWLHMTLHTKTKTRTKTKSYSKS